MNNPRKRNAVESRRAAGRIIAGVEQEKRAAYARECVVKVQAEFLATRDGILASVSAGESKELHFKVKGVCHRRTERVRRDARVAHAEVAKVIVRVLPVTHPIRLGLALNFSRQGGGARTGVQLGSGDGVETQSEIDVQPCVSSLMWSRR